FAWTAWEYAPVKDSAELLKMLLERYWAGLMHPLRFFPDSSWEYARSTLRDNRLPQEAYRRARDIWRGKDFTRGEWEDPYYQLCFKNMDPLDMEFRILAEEIFEPLLKHQKKVP
ncbi:MAG: hypothetical protein ABIG67_01920, partial [Pseudomonadota bacterium]